MCAELAIVRWLLCGAHAHSQLRLASLHRTLYTWDVTQAKSSQIRKLGIKLNRGKGQAIFFSRISSCNRAMNWLLWLQHEARGMSHRPLQHTILLRHCNIVSTALANLWWLWHSTMSILLPFSHDKITQNAINKMGESFFSSTILARFASVVAFRRREVRPHMTLRKSDSRLILMEHLEKERKTRFESFQFAFRSSFYTYP